MFGKACELNTRGTQLNEWLTTGGRGMVGAVIVESASKVIRDHETRGSSNQKLFMFKVWVACMSTSSFQHFNRHEVAIGASMPPPDWFSESLSSAYTRLEDTAEPLASGEPWPPAARKREP